MPAKIVYTDTANDSNLCVRLKRAAFSKTTARYDLK
jgi:hypothetical protein